MSTPETYEILVLKYGEMTARHRRDNFLHPDDHDAPMPIDYFVWVIRNENRTILVDTGFDHKEAKLRGRALALEPRDALAQAGIDADTIEDVIITHLHYDHAGTLSHFPAARFHLQDTEMAYATGRCMCEGAMNVPFTVDHVCEMVRHVYSGRVVFHDGDGEVAPGVTVHHMPGHSKGIQSVRVLTKGGWVVVASDAVHFYENIERRKPFFITIDTDATLRSYSRLAKLASSPAQIVPGHDPLVLKRYPAWKPATEGVIHRLDVARLDTSPLAK